MALLDPWVMVLRLVSASVLGGMIGLQRESVNKTAGFRTHLLVSVGAALIMLMSIYGFQGTSRPQDPARMAAQVVSGIGFLGAGTIMKEGLSVKGLTTAASLWVVSAIGLACGSGMYLSALLTAVIVFVSLSLFARMDRVVRSANQACLTVICRDQPGMLGMIGSVLGAKEVSIENVSLSQQGMSSGNLQVDLAVRLPHYVTKEEVIAALITQEGLYNVQSC